MTAIVKHIGYCGMLDIRDSFDTLAEARSHAADLLRTYRQDYKVATIERGESWEILEPDDCAMVPDDCGILRITRITHECRECGSLYDSADDAAICCNEQMTWR